MAWLQWLQTRKFSCNQHNLKESNNDAISKEKKVYSYKVTTVTYIFTLLAFLVSGELLPCEKSHLLIFFF